MEAEVIAIGDELTSGQRLDTNSKWLSQELSNLGIRTVRHTTIGDDLAHNVDALRQAAQRVDIVVCTGGLGPTLDDLTRQAFADAFDAPLELDEDSLEHIRQLFVSRGRDMPERNRAQALFPRGSQTIPNPHGSAPGIDFTSAKDSCRFFALPGVPAEMTEMWFHTVVPRIESMAANPLGPLRFHAVKVFGIGESDVEVRLPKLISRDRIPTVGITVSRATITLRIAGRAHSNAEFQELIAPTVAEIHAALGSLVFGEGDDELEHVVHRLLRQARESLACVEIGAASLVSDWFLQLSSDLEAQDSSEGIGGFVGGIAFPSLKQAHHWLAETSLGDIPKEQDDGAWMKLAENVRRRFGSDYGLVIGTYPTASQMIEIKSFEFVFAIASARGTLVRRRHMGGHPDVLGPRVGKTALDFLRRKLDRGIADDQ